MNGTPSPLPRGPFRRLLDFWTRPIPLPTPLRGLLRWLLDFWTRPVRAEPLALFRILIGAFCFFSVASNMLPRLGRDLGPDGLCPVAAFTGWESYAKPRFCLLRGPTNIRALDQCLPPDWLAGWRDWCDDPGHAAVLMGVLLAALACMTVGLFTRHATILSWALFVSFNARLVWLMNGGDSMLRCALFYLMFTPAGAAWSLDRRLPRAAKWWLNVVFSLLDGAAALLLLLLAARGLIQQPLAERIGPAAYYVAPGAAAAAAAAFFLGRLFLGGPQPGGPAPGAPVLIAPWSVRLLQIQLAFVYFFTGLSKIGGDWLDGQAVYWVLNDMSLNRWPYARLPVPLLACRFLSWATLVFEIGFPFFLLFGAWGAWRRLTVQAQGKTPYEGYRFVAWLPPLRPWLLLAGVFFHLGILVHTEVGFFSPATASWYALFLSGDWLGRFFGMGRRRGGKRRVATAEGEENREAAQERSRDREGAVQGS
jgi:hypothetical protein